MSRGPTFYYLGLPVRLSARRPNGSVLVENLLRGSFQPMGTWRELDPDKLQHARLSGQHLHDLVAVLPLVEFVTDRPEADPRPARLPYADT